MKNNSNLSILVIDDDPVTRFIHQKLIALIDIKIFYSEAINGKRALDMITNKEIPFPDIILVDINMPVMDGFQFIRNFKKLYGSEHTQLVIVSSSQCAIDIKIGISLGADHFVSKPISKIDLNFVIGETLLPNLPYVA